MPSLQVRELPENIHQLLQEQARRNCRSLSCEAVVTLARGLKTVVSQKDRRARVLETIKKNSAIADDSIQADPADLIREDRDR